MRNKRVRAHFAEKAGSGGISPLGSKGSILIHLNLLDYKVIGGILKCVKNSFEFAI